jgi:signal transduction histidine kinase
MKLLNITNRYYIIIALVLLLLSSAFLAYRVVYIVDNEVSEHMLFEKQEIEKQLSLQEDLQKLHFIVGDRIEIEPLDKFTSFRVAIKDTVIFDLYENEKVPYRQLSYQQLVKGKSYNIKISRRLTENRQLISGIFVSLLLVSVDIIICFYFLNRWFSSRVWNPFYRALNVLKNFDVQKGGNVEFQASKVDEFNTLNEELEKLTDKVTRDYRNLREFTENMSHETQTPLAIIRSKLEILLQNAPSEENANQILSTLDSVNRLSKMNKGLIMLTRIENEQYSGQQELHLGNLIRKHLDDLELFITSREVKVHTNIDENVYVHMNPHLAEILFTNLLSNAIKYNINGGDLYIDVTHEGITIANSGKPLTIPGREVFERFKKGDAPDSVGLGLAIVKKIIDHQDFTIGYDYVNNLHTFRINFENADVEKEAVEA